ncbi:peptidase S26 [Arthrobacter sp. ERGS1:01]|uniref:signal peptidase I n=1 Tax=Arthrobacter sp. ERGS1:01 TaxID=1704044 RepID=UPI0006B3FDB1|nr:signal peptidase I [Arthrobacter sp. ERGS1:01]ALE05170.1 peptidase S26 [Arthrobacter sp. ERGS1:01]
MTTTSTAATATLAASRRGVPAWLRLAGRGTALVLLAAAALAALVLVLIPMATGSQSYTVLTNSMAPKYAPGTFLVVKPEPFAALKLGDIVTYQLESGKPAVISHRIIAIGATQAGERVLTTKGDNNSVADPNPVREVQVKGKLLYAVPYVGFVANTVGHSNRAALVPVIAVVLIGFGALNLVQGGLSARKSRKSPRHALRLGSRA